MSLFSYWLRQSEFEMGGYARVYLEKQLYKENMILLLSNLTADCGGIDPLLIEKAVFPHYVSLLGLSFQVILILILFAWCI